MDTNAENRDYKYVMSDYSNVYLGGKFSYRNIIENVDVNFKIKSIAERHLMQELEPDTSLESHFYFMKPEDEVAKVYKQLKAKVKVCMLEEKKHIGGKVTNSYKTRVLSMDDFFKINLAQRKAKGMVIQEIILPKLGFMTFVL